MKFAEFEEEARSLIEDACSTLGYDSSKLEVSMPPNSTYGDLSSAVPLRIARQRGERPGEVALRLADAIMKRSDGYHLIGSVAAHQGGYLNFTLDFARFSLESLVEVNSSKSVGSSPPTRKRIAIEHTNVNPNKALHVGHVRNLVLGDSLVRVMRHLGNEVDALNYVDDSGAQVADVIVGFRFLGLSDQNPPGTKFDSYCGDDVYAKVNREYSTNPSLKEKQSLVLREIEKGEGEIADYARKIVERILADQLTTCWRLGATYDLLNWESQIVHSGMWEVIFERMKKSGDVKLETSGENRGCWVIPDPETGEQKVVVRSDGTVVYVAKDIPYAAWKIGLIEDPFDYVLYSEGQPGGRPLYTSVLGKKSGAVRFGAADLAISVIDTRQSYLQRIVARVLDKFVGGASRRYLHRSYEVVALSKKTAESLGFGIEGDFAHMSGRKGIYVNADKVLDALKLKARSETRKRNLGESDQWVDEVAEAIAVSALRYDLLKQDPDKMIVFDLEEALRFEGDTGPYLLYTYARARRIVDKTEGRPEVTPESAVKLTQTPEKELVKKLSMLDIAVATAGEYLSPKEVAVYAHDLAIAFNEFYEKVQVNREEDLELRNARLALVEAASRVLAEAMQLMGLPYRARI